MVDCLDKIKHKFNKATQLQIELLINKIKGLKNGESKLRCCKQCNNCKD